MRQLDKEKLINFHVVVSRPWLCRALRLGLLAVVLVLLCLGIKSVAFQDFLLFCVNNLTQQELALICVIAWRLWFLRNRYIHDGGLIEVISVVDWCKNFLVEYEAAGGSGDSVVASSVGIRSLWPESFRWKAPVSNASVAITTETIDSSNGKISAPAQVTNTSQAQLANSQS
ncbi:hypothetical protein QYF36_000641 [Acer negundo]|nr:hypothetical protein QYF36_000641 [Acer negundo]